MAVGKKRKRTAQALGLDNSVAATNSEETATKRQRPSPESLPNTQASSEHQSITLASSSSTPSADVSPAAEDAKLTGKAARKLKKKLAEKNKKRRLREKAESKRDNNGRSLPNDSKRHVLADPEGGTKISKRMKKRANWLAKHPKPLPSVAASVPEKTHSEVRARGKDIEDRKRPVPSTKAKLGHTRSSKPLIEDDDLSDVELPYMPIGATSYDDYEQDPEETYLGKRARKSSGKGGKGKGRQKPGGSVHLSKKEKKAKREAKDATNADKVGKKQRGGSKSKGKGKGKGKRKGSQAVGTRKERRHKSKGRGKGKGGK